MLGSAGELLDSDSGSVMLLEGQDLVVACSHGNERAEGGRVRLGHGIAGRVAEKGEALLVQGAADPDDFPGLVPHEHPVHSAISAPLIHRDELLGVLNVNSSGERVFTEFDLRAVSLFAEQAAAAIANARLYELERAQVEELTHLNRLKSEFIALVSHELRTPIASIIGAVSSSRKPELADHRDELEDIVERAATRLGTMVEDLLSAAELERGDAVRRLEPIDVANVAREAAADHGVLDREIVVTAPQRAVVLCDHEYMRRILDNLLDNAFKYGRPPVRIDVTADAESVSLSVLDAGGGVAEADRDKIFDRFRRLDTLNGHGLGLGLSVVHGLVEAMGGTISIEEAPGGGAAFRIRFPQPAATMSDDALSDGDDPMATTSSPISRSVS
jgi:two-component system sensor histidine kinase KdpD